MTPDEILYHQKSAVLELVYKEHSFELSAEYLRVFSPSAEVQGHSPEQAVLQHGKKDVQIANLVPQGNYAIKIVFSDGHDSGIYTWQYLFDLGENKEGNWSNYLARLSAAGKKRESQFIAVGKN